MLAPVVPIWKKLKLLAKAIEEAFWNEESAALEAELTMDRLYSEGWTQLHINDICRDTPTYIVGYNPVGKLSMIVISKERDNDNQ